MKVYSGTMKVGTLEAGLLRVNMKKSSRTRRNRRATALPGRDSTLESQAAVVRGLQAAQRWSESRAARIEELRAQIEAGTYKVDSMTLAERMLENQTHFLEED